MKNKTVIRIVLVGNQHGDWFGHENDRHNVGELFQVLAHARPDTLFLHKVTGDKEERLIVDILPPPELIGTQSQTWARMEAERLQSFGYNAVPAPEWKE